MNSKKLYQMELVHTTFITPMLQTLQNQVQSGYSSVFSVASDNLPDGSEIVLRVTDVNVTSHRIAHLVTEHLSCLRLHQQAIAVMGLIRLVYLFVYVQHNVGRDGSVGIVTHYGLDGLGSGPRRGRIFRAHPDLLWGPPSLLYIRYRVSFPGIKWLGRDVDHPPPSSTKVKERVELYLYSPSGPSCPVLISLLLITFYLY